MNVLYLSHRVPYPPNKGDRIRTYHTLRALAAAHDVTCVCFSDDRADGVALTALKALTLKVHAVPLSRGAALTRGAVRLARGGTVTEGFYASRRMRDTLRRVTRERSFDAVLAFSGCMAQHALSVPAERHILDLCELDSEKWRGYAARSWFPMSRVYGREAERLARRERCWARSFDAVVVISDAEAGELAPHVPSGQLHVVRNGVHIPAGRMDPDGPPPGVPKDATPEAPDSRGDDRGGGGPLPHGRGAARRRTSGRVSGGPLPHGRGSVVHRQVSSGTAPDGSGGGVDRTESIVGFVGQMNYPPNVEAVTWFVRTCWPTVRAAEPRAVFRIVGRRPTRSVRRLARVAGVEVMGAVADVGAHLASLSVSVAPLRVARGVQNKVLEAMASGLPVVLTPAAARGIAARDPDEWRVAEGAAEFAGHVVDLLGDAALRVRLGEAARRFVARQYRWEKELARLVTIVEGTRPGMTQTPPDEDAGAAQDPSTRETRADCGIEQPVQP
jgi:glycosyltransferase involved in cell wall biosynthesis